MIFGERTNMEYVSYNKGQMTKTYSFCSKIITTHVGGKKC